MPKKRPTISKIKNAVAQHFNIEAQNINVQNNSHEFALPRLMTVFLTSAAGHSNADIANGLHYRSPGHVSTKLNKAHNFFNIGKEDFHVHAEKIAKTLRLSLN